MKINLNELHSQYLCYKEEINLAIQKVLDSCQFIMGPEVFEFENALSQYLNCKYVISCASGTDALMLALKAIDISQGDEVITTPLTFAATAETVGLLNAKPVFVDIQSDTYNIDPTKIEEKISTKTRAIIPVSLHGQTSDMDEINNIAREYSKKFGKKIFVIEDAAQSLGAEYKGRKSSNLSDMGCLSFFPSKPLGCYGDGGAVIVNDEEIAEKLKNLRVHGQVKRYYHKYLGFNGRLDTIQAAVLNVKLKYFNKELISREIIAHRYREMLKNSELILPLVKPDRTSVYAQFVIRIKRRKEVMESLQQKNIITGLHFPLPLHLQECFKYLNYHEGDMPIAEKISNEILSLPMSAFITETQQAYVANSLQEILETVY